MILEFAPGKAAQVDFGAGPQVVDPDSGQAQGLGIHAQRVFG